MKYCDAAILKQNLAPLMIHELLLSVTETAFGSHPCRVVSVTYHPPLYFHGGNTGSNPVGDAKVSNSKGRLRSGTPDLSNPSKPTEKELTMQRIGRILMRRNSDRPGLCRDEAEALDEKNG